VFDSFFCFLGVEPSDLFDTFSQDFSGAPHFGQVLVDQDADWPDLQYSGDSFRLSVVGDEVGVVELFAQLEGLFLIARVHQNQRVTIL
jgi:hypothetical protein